MSGWSSCSSIVSAFLLGQWEKNTALKLQLNFCCEHMPFAKSYVVSSTAAYWNPAIKSLQKIWSKMASSFGAFRWWRSPTCVSWPCPFVGASSHGGLSFAHVHTSGPSFQAIRKHHVMINSWTVEHDCHILSLYIPGGQNWRLHITYRLT